MYGYRLDQSQNRPQHDGDHVFGILSRSILVRVCFTHVIPFISLHSKNPFNSILLLLLPPQILPYVSNQSYSLSLIHSKLLNLILQTFSHSLDLILLEIELKNTHDWMIVLRQ